MLNFDKEDKLKYSDYAENDLFSVIEPICRGFKAKIVQLNTASVKSSMQVRIVLYKEGGINIDTCTEISRAVMPRIEVWADNRDVNLEVSSPGIGRTFRDAWEFAVFTNEKIKILVDSEWIEGVIVSEDEKAVVIKSEEKDTEYLYEQIQKAKLD